ncbi:MAG TPA: rod shape-determining protein MreC [Bacteroides sp.]|nr:rod shape-determining protein MreC [Bacteroides sp.]
MRTLLRFIQKYFNLLLFLILEAIAIFLIVRGSYYQQSRFVQMNRQITGFIYDRVDGTREYLSLKKVNRQLALENMQLRNRVEQLSGSLDTARVLRVHKEPYWYYYVPAKIVHNSVYKQYNYITIDKGKKDGVFRDMGVISDQGLVGIVLESSGNFSTVIPVINRDFRLSVKIKSNNYAGILFWEGDSPLYAGLSEIPFHVELTVGDTIVTSGYSAIFPDGIEVGQIASFSLESGNFYDIRVKLFTEYQSLFHINVIRNYRQDEQINLEQNARR